MHISESINSVSTDWLPHNGKRYLQQDYLELLEEHGPIGYRQFYAILKRDKTIIANFYFQLKRFDLNKDYRIHTHSKNFLPRLWVSVQKFLFSFIKRDMLICGNVLLTGNYGVSRSDDQNEIKIDQILKTVSAYLKAEKGVTISYYLLKDFFKETQADIFSRSESVHGFSVQPTMIMDFDPEWNEFSDYLAAVKSKYRVKFKKVMKKGKDLEFIDMDEDMARKYNPEMYKMYKSTADRAAFSLFTLSPEYFSELKASLKDDLELTGVFLEGKLVAFFSFVSDGKNADAHFLGYNTALNNKYQIYFNILLRLVEKAIIHKAGHMNLSRTALEIKSSVGAKAHPMQVYFKHKNALINQLVPWVMKTFVPEEEWLPRNPFK